MAPRKRAPATGCALFITIVLFIIMKYALFANDTILFAWLKGNVYVPIQVCVNGTRYKNNISLFETCTATVELNQSFGFVVSPSSAARVSNELDSPHLSTVSWTDLTGGNICTPGTPMYEQYGKRNKLCKETGGEPALNFATHDFEILSAGNVCFVFLVVHLVVRCIPFEFFLGQIVANSMHHLSVIGCFITGVYVVSFWDNFPLVQNYFDRESPGFVPMRTRNITLMGFKRVALLCSGTLIPHYEVPYDEELVVNIVPVLLEKSSVTHGMGSILMIFLMFGFVFLWSLACLETFLIIEEENKRKREQEDAERRLRWRHVANPSGVRSQSPEVAEPDPTTSSTIPRPNRPAPPMPQNIDVAATDDETQMLTAA